jgi:hypothetical protein
MAKAALAEEFLCNEAQFRANPLHSRGGPGSSCGSRAKGEADLSSARQA